MEFISSVVIAVLGLLWIGRPRKVGIGAGGEIVGDHGSSLKMQPDGNLALYDGEMLRWSANTIGKGNRAALVGSRLAIFDARGEIIWSAGPPKPVKARFFSLGVSPTTVVIVADGVPIYNIVSAKEITKPLPLVVLGHIH